MRTILQYNGLKHLTELRQIYSGKNILLVTGKSSFEKSGAKKIVESKLANEKVLQFNAFSTNPKIADACLGAQLAREHDTEVIIAIGGGSVIDIAKLIKAFYLSNGNEVDLATGKRKVKDPGIPLIAVPTTAGSGSEATHFAVVYIESEKYSLASDCLLPNAVILDGALAASCQQYLKACNALDAMAQAIESFWALGSTDESRKYSTEALQLGWNTMLSYAAESFDAFEAQKMIEAAHLAGKAINISRTTAAHAWSYAFTSGYDIPHGHAVWLTLPAIYRIHSQNNIEGPTETADTKTHQQKMEVLHSILGLDTNANLELQLINHLKKIQIECQMEELGIGLYSDRLAISKKVNMERMSNNPINLSLFSNEIFRL